MTPNHASTSSDHHGKPRDSEADARAFALAHSIVALLNRAFFSCLPVLLLWQGAEWSFPSALAGGIAGGYALEAFCRRLFAEEESD